MNVTNSILCFLFSALANTGTAVVSEKVIFTGTIEYLEPKGEPEYSHDKAFYIHENTQFLVVNIERILVGGLSASRVILGVSVDDRGGVGTLWLSPSYGVLDPGFWKQESEVVVLANTGADENSCSPATWIFKPGIPRPDGVDPNVEVIYEDDGLQAFYGSPVLCTSIEDIFIVMGLSSTGRN